jgi:hypothetical protein
VLHHLALNVREIKVSSFAPVLCDKFEIQIFPSPADPPENVTITPNEVQVVEGKAPPRLSCSASAHPSKFHYPSVVF